MLFRSRIAHDVALADPSAIHGVRAYLGITTLADGRTRSIRGTAGGNDAAWSPDGKWLAFDRVTAGDPSIYAISPSGGTRRLIHRDAASPDISPSGDHSGFQSLLSLVLVSWLTFPVARSFTKS